MRGDTKTKREQNKTGKEQNRTEERVHTAIVRHIRHMGEEGFFVRAPKVFVAPCRGVAGYVGMWVAVRSNVRVASAACRSFQEERGREAQFHRVLRCASYLWTIIFNSAALVLDSL